MKKLHITIHAVAEVPDDINLRELHTRTLAKRIVLIHKESERIFDVQPKISYIKEWKGFPE